MPLSFLSVVSAQFDGFPLYDEAFPKKLFHTSPKTLTVMKTKKTKSANPINTPPGPYIKQRYNRALVSIGKSTRGIPGGIYVVPPDKEPRC